MNWFKKHSRNGWATSAIVSFFIMIGIFNFTSTLIGDGIIVMGFVLSLFGMWNYDKVITPSKK